ncbi:MAG: M1 family metallopeptidase, partial [Calditrichaeota bacterium]|nr:M1 family metallopeptidase [Calditrichota bacterium]
MVNFPTELFKWLLKVFRKQWQKIVILNLPQADEESPGWEKGIPHFVRNDSRQTVIPRSKATRNLLKITPKTIEMVFAIISFQFEEENPMKKWMFLLLWLGLGTAPVWAQHMPYDPAHSLGIAYRSAENPYYWKNRPPVPGYWQQDVNYTIEVRLTPKNRLLTAHETLIYYNNSPDTLREAFFHLYQNAYKKGSYLDRLRRSHGDYSIARLKKSQEGGTDIQTLVDGSGQPLHFSVDNTIMRVELNRPLLPGDSTTFQIDFTTRFSTLRHRMKYNPSHGFDQFTATQWYPKICVYDRRFGWTTDQHLGHEFYGDFGTFDVKITLPQEFIVGATGYLLNRNEVLPPELMKKLRIENFKNKPFGQKPSVIIPHVDGKTKTWHYHAVNVHDFAWTADPTYRIGEVTLKNGVKVYALAREWKAVKWQDAAQFAADVVRIYSRDIGPFGYHKMIVADADDGMEYPMITMDGGTSPGYYGLFAHEEGHNWFYGMIGNNETYRALLDEGFTQFLTSWSMERLVGRKQDHKTKKFPYKGTSWDRYRNFKAYLNTARMGYDAPITTHSDWFENSVGYNSYRLGYYKTFTMLYNLQYVLGDSLFLKALQTYFARWKFCHPYVQDFRNVVTQVAHRDLNWFFDEWLNYTWSLDYAVKGIRNKKVGTGYEAQIKLKRKGQMIMPLDLQVTLDDGSQRRFQVPVDDWAKSPAYGPVLPKWVGIGELDRTYTAKIRVPQRVKSVGIDPSGRLADWYQLDNRSGFPPKIRVARPFRYEPPPLDAYLVQWNPTAWYNDVDGVRLGLRAHGSYLESSQVLGEHTLDVGIWYATRAPKYPLAYRFSLKEPLRKWGKDVYWQVESEALAGLAYNALSFSQRWNNYAGFFRSTRLTLKLEAYNLYDRSYLWNSDFWQGQKMTRLHVRLEQVRRFPHGESRWSLALTSGYVSTYLPPRWKLPVIGPPSFANPIRAHAFNKVELLVNPSLDLGRGFGVRLRGTAGYGFGGLLPSQSRFY